MFNVIVVEVSAIVSYTMAVFSVLARAATLPTLATLTDLPTAASSSKPRLTHLAKTRFDSVARSTCLLQMSGEKMPSAMVLPTNAVAPVATGHIPFGVSPVFMGRVRRSPPLFAAHVDIPLCLDVVPARFRASFFVEALHVFLERHGTDLGSRDLAGTFACRSGVQLGGHFASDGG